MANDDRSQVLANNKYRRWDNPLSVAAPKWMANGGR
jgi:hypothetical protein